jgi:hypothetical protein
MEMEKANQGEDITVDGTQQNNNQQPSPAVSDSQVGNINDFHYKYFKFSFISIFDFG